MRRIAIIVLTFSFPVFLAAGASYEKFRAAMYPGDMQKLRKLVERDGADIKGKFTGVWNGWTPLLIAVHVQNLEAAEYLLKKGAPPDAVFPRGSRPAGLTPLMYAAKNAWSPWIKLLLKHGADLNRVHPERGSALHIALRGRTKAHRLVARQLIAGGANINTRVSAGPYRGQTPLMISVYRNDVNMARLLINLNANLSARWQAIGYENYTAGMLARLLGNRKMIRLFRAAGDPSWKTPVRLKTMRELRACAGDRQCVKVRTQPCGCSAGGGGDISVNGKFAAYYYRHYYRPKTRTRYCKMVYLCRGERAFCRAGSCVFGHKSRAKLRSRPE